MKVTDATRRILAYRRDKRKRIADGWEFVNSDGGKLWEINRGWRWDHVITHVEIAVGGKGLWVKTARNEK